jgi:DNA polymerase-3 subunit gamma/tau
MSYLVLARKWRPQGFDDLIGQEPITRVLKNAIDQGKIAHAYLFSGPRGVGKTSTARILAKALNCQAGATSSPCGSCSFCTSITDGSSVDVMEIDGASNNSVNDIRDLRERVKYVPSGGRYKVYIIDETHMLSDAAFNALLKTLEEPPPHVVFVLATTAPRKIPSTVLSRCQHLPFRRIPGLMIKDRLRKISTEESISISGPALEIIARAADGSLRDSLTILDQISSFSSDISETDVKDLLGITDFSLLSQLASSLIEGKRKEILTITAELAEKGTDIRSFIRELIQFFRDMLVLSIVKKPDEMLDLGKEDLAAMQNILRRTSEDHLTLLLSELLRAELDVRNASSPRLALEMSLLKASFLRDMKPLREVIENLEKYIKLVPDSGDADTEKISPAITHDAVPGNRGSERESSAKLSQDQEEEFGSLSATVSEEPPVSASEGQTITDDIRERALRKMAHPLQSKLSNASFKIDGDTLILTLNGGDSVFSDSLRKNGELIAQIFSEELGNTVNLEVVTAKKKVVRRKDLKEEVMADSAIQEVLELFDGRIVDVMPIKKQTE